jgi:hypothetical protein
MEVSSGENEIEWLEDADKRYSMLYSTGRAMIRIKPCMQLAMTCQTGCLQGEDSARCGSWREDAGGAGAAV